MSYVIILHVSGSLSGSWSSSVFCYSENCPWQGHYVHKAPSCLAFPALTHPSWHASHLLTTVCNAYDYFPTVPETSSPTSPQGLGHFPSSHSHERPTSKTSLGRPLYTTPSQLGQSYPTIPTT